MLSLLLLALASDAGDAFNTPSGNISCAAWQEKGRWSIRCDLAANDARRPPRPADCELDWGSAFGLSEKGRASRLCAGDTVAGEHPVLAYGTSWTRGGITCSSSEKGLRCVNASGHGFLLSRRRQVLD